MQEYSIIAKNITKIYNKQIALNDLSFEIKKNELFGFIGPDGAGKTSLFRILSTLILPDKGEAIIEDFNVVKNFKKIRTILGYMPQRFSLYHDLTVEENLKFFSKIFGQSIEENYDLIKDIYSQIEPFKNRQAGKLSGGMKQKLALSCALIHKPKVLILDEPTTGVDAVSRKEFWEMLKRLQKKDITIIVSTPYMDEAEKCDRIALIQSGEILKIDTPHNIIKQFKNRLIAIRSNEIYKLLNDLKNYPNIKSLHTFGQFIHVTFEKDAFDIEEISRYLMSKQHNDLVIKEIKPNVEDCFMELMITKNEK